MACNRRKLVVVALLAVGCGDDATSPFDSMGAGATAVGTQGASDGNATTSPAADSTGGTGAGGTAADSESGGGIKLDVGAADDGGVGGCGCEHTYIWVANTNESTVSKINTRTLEEEGRYLTREDGNGSPSRTSVNLVGDVAVANRYGGLTKFWASVDSCVDRNGDGVIQTSTGKADVLSWAAEECRAWYTPFNTTNQRPVAWTGGTVGAGDCDVTDAKVWTVTSAVPGFPGLGGEGGVIAYIVGGETGLIEETVAFPEFNGSTLGAYGGAVDSVGNLWITSQLFGAGQLGRVDWADLTAQVYMMPADVSPYGITVDHLGRPWLSNLFGSGAARFDPDTVTWDLAVGFSGGSGLAEGPNGLFMYVSANSTVREVDLETLALGGTFTTNQTVKGVGFDVDGFMWAVTQADEKIPGKLSPAYKVDVATMMAVGQYDGLDAPYTYSDMTGSALGNVTCPPAG